MEIPVPGHTPESISVLVYDHAGDAAPHGVLTGDALFRDVSRPDLLVSVGGTAAGLGAPPPPLADQDRGRAPRTFAARSRGPGG